MESASAATSNILEQIQRLLDRDFERQRKHEKKWKKEMMKDMKDELREFKNELKNEYKSSLDIEKITLKNVMAEYKNSFDMGVQETAALGAKLHEQVQASLDQHRERVVNEVKRNNEAKFSLLERKSRVGTKSIVKGFEETCNKMKSNVDVMRSVVANIELKCNQTNTSVKSLISVLRRIRVNKKRRNASTPNVRGCG